MDLEEIFKSIIAIIIFGIFLSAFAPLLGAAIGSGSSFIVGFAFLAVILAFLMKILQEFGGIHG